MKFGDLILERVHSLGGGWRLKLESYSKKDAEPGDKLLTAVVFLSPEGNQYAFSGDLDDLFTMAWHADRAKILSMQFQADANAESGHFETE